MTNRVGLRDGDESRSTEYDSSIVHIAVPEVDLHVRDKLMSTESDSSIVNVEAPTEGAAR